MLLVMGAYIAVWQYGNKVGRRKEAERIEHLKAEGWLKEKDGFEDELNEDVDDEIPF